jgi:hypothetical protein
MAIGKALNRLDHLMKYLMRAAIVLTIFALASCQANQNAAEQSSAPSQDQTQVSSAVFIFNSEACDCEKQRNMDAEKSIEFFLKSKDARQLKRIDIAKHPEELEMHQKLTRISFLPVLLGLDETGGVVEKVEGIFDNKQKTLENIFH